MHSAVTEPAPVFGRCGVVGDYLPGLAVQLLGPLRRRGLGVAQAGLVIVDLPLPLTIGRVTPPITPIPTEPITAAGR